MTGPRIETDDEELRSLVGRYLAALALPTDDLWLTDDRATYSRWLGRSIPGRYGGAYCYLSRHGKHAVLINLPRIDRARPRALEIVVCEELVHMRDHIDGDRRRHAHHGHDRIARRVAAMTGASLEEVRSCLIPVERRPLRYAYRCPGCSTVVRRRKRGTWSCGRCSPAFDPRFILQLLAE